MRSHAALSPSRSPPIRDGRIHEAEETVGRRKTTFLRAAVRKQRAWTTALPHMRRRPRSPSRFMRDRLENFSDSGKLACEILRCALEAAADVVQVPVDAMLVNFPVAPTEKRKRLHHPFSLFLLVLSRRLRFSMRHRGILSGAPRFRADTFVIRVCPARPHVREMRDRRSDAVEGTTPIERRSRSSIGKREKEYTSSSCVDRRAIARNRNVISSTV